MRAGALLALALLAACGHTNPAPPPPAPVAAAPRASESCFQELKQDGIGYTREKDFHNAEGCGIDQAVKVDRSPIPLNHAALMACSFAATLATFETKVVQPAAQKLLKHKVTKLLHLGTYACRGEVGGNPNRLSQHAYGKAIDVSGFELEGGDTISVLKDWRGDTAKARFLHEIAKGACGIFDVVITPNHNAFHVDHIHMDTGPYKLCGM